MNHLAIIRRNSLDKILDGTKTVESRFSKQLPPAWKCEPGDIIYFKETGGDIRCIALVGKVEKHHLDAPYELLSLEPSRWQAVHGRRRNQQYWFDASRRGVRYAVFATLEIIERIHIPASLLPKNLPYASAWITNFDPPSTIQPPLM